MRLRASFCVLAWKFSRRWEVLYCSGPLPARSSLPLQLQFESIFDIWHQKLSSGLRGGAESFFSGTGTREIRPALTAGGILRVLGATCGMGDGL